MNWNTSIEQAMQLLPNEPRRHMQHANQARWIRNEIARIQALGPFQAPWVEEYRRWKISKYQEELSLLDQGIQLQHPRAHEKIIR